ncbi:MAG: LysE family transporter [Micromonosporaceae bacterium]|nr:LysE family transporter [Micromonosporaceae bacterium]
MATSLIAFAVFAALLTITPGVDTLLVLRASAAGGRSAGIAAATGIGLGCLAWATAGAIGVTAVLAASQLAFDVLRLAGAAYLCWLGARALWSVRRRRSNPALPSSTDPAPSGAPALSTSSDPVPSGSGAPALAAPDHAGEPGERWSRWRGLRAGLTTNLLNPKVGVFYLSVLPQFLPTGLPPLAGALALAMIHVIEGLLWLSLLAVLVTRARSWLTRPAVRRRFEQVTGAVLLALGLRLAIDH